MKSALFNRGRDLMHEFCEANKLSVPEIDQKLSTEWRFDSTCAYYREDVISICVPRCAAIGVAGQAWSYPGYVIDRTPYGVVQHELGHHVDFSRSDVKGAYGGDFSAKMRQLSGEDKLTNYCPNNWEWFAEMFRLFVTNSDLLRAVRPRLYAQLRELYRPVVDAPWRAILKDAPDRTFAMAAKKAGEYDL